ncbi:unnamed protein product [Prorocentrum cordatum]|uniref:Menorin-like domain-containing protein n=1 Tax=Prorocentrum cordatum TaxID=2364126 RepID=A0ABN9VSG9_9DINO|nr:unnamed protein product [Polarella glacialis]
MAGGRWVPMPDPAHSACTRQKLAAALADGAVRAIEADILMGTVAGAEDAEERPIMAHPPLRTSDLPFEDFLQECLADGGRRHLKLDFKELRAVRQCLPEVARATGRLRENGQAIWLNADVLPGPGCRGKAPTVPADEFLKAVADSCPGAPLSLGWSVYAVARDCYSQADCDAMARLCEAGPAGAGRSPVVFAACARLAARGPQPLVGLLRRVEGSQLLLWTGTREPPVSRRLLDDLGAVFRQAGLEGRVGYDCAVAASGFATFKAELTVALARVCFCV